MQLHCPNLSIRRTKPPELSSSCVICVPGPVVRKKVSSTCSRHKPAKFSHSSLSIELQAARRACKPLRSLMWDGSGGDMTLSEQLLSLREQDSMDEEEGPMATVNFHLRYKTNFGQGIKLIGSDPKLGECYMGGFWKEAKRLQGELMQKNGENQGLRNELSQLRMELSLEQQSRTQIMSQMKELKVENAGLKNRLAQKTVELNRTLSEVLDMLDAGMLDGDDVLGVNGEAGSAEEDEDARWLSQRGLGAGLGSSGNDYGSDSEYGSRFPGNNLGDTSSSYSSATNYCDNSWNDFSSSNDQGVNISGEYDSSSSGEYSYNGRYQSRPSDILFGEVAAEGQGMGEPKKPLVGWEADAEAQAQAAELQQYELQRSNSTRGYSSWRSSEEEVPSSSSLGSASSRQGATW
ncbi:hypothetical protein DUNSADRAFT_1454 [Dunaliella salina]|uniref:Uncharacterized protein n=1 Tax=Dunaliella salina TaxID=3046 RepID=A0ABQ7GX81_DUNSA|nr:hypothetical protein DUNSADRAFT_1454 [Dunaliella salina]|eukprot:KAF5839142.1 hypothetical protein DUNSADRAFT_1454 [Dunaliella salina]